MSVPHDDCRTCRGVSLRRHEDYFRPSGRQLRDQEDLMILLSAVCAWFGLHVGFHQWSTVVSFSSLFLQVANVGRVWFASLGGSTRIALL